MIELLGIDLGSVNVKVACREAGSYAIRAACVSSRGRPLEALARALQSLPGQVGRAGGVRVAVTGGNQALLPEHPAIRRVNEVVATATAAHDTWPAARTVIDLGGQFSKWILLASDPRQAGTVVDFATNGLCAAGSGAFLEQQAGRLKLSLAELGLAAHGASRGVTIAGRCSVFAKSDMIHLQQKGTPVDQVAYGLCLALVRTFISTVMDGRPIEPPIVLVGGGAANPGLCRAFREVLEIDGSAILVPEDPFSVGASGAALHAADSPAIAWADLIVAVTERSGAECCTIGSMPAVLPALSREDVAGDLRLPEEPPVPEGAVDAYLGVDVGSVSTNLVVMSGQMEVLRGVYLPTRGRPVEVLDEGLSSIREQFGARLRILGVGVTGSGRHLAAKVLGVDIVRNEITAQLASAAHFVPDVDTVFEIGGQDSKYIAVRDGRLTDFEMNKICAAGTGSFLEEQAERLGISIIDEFGERALAAAHPRDLGTRCTVFMETELVRAQESGAALEDLCAGLSYSVSRNYLEKVVAGRPVGRCIVFQGGTASNAAVVAAFRGLLRRPVHVHPYNRISGAIGAALLAARAMALEPYATRFLGFDSCADARFASFECRHCENLCQVNRIVIRDRVVHFGAICERYSERDRDEACASRPFPELFAERDALLESFIRDDSPRASSASGEAIGLLRSSLNLEYLPLWVAFLRALGFRPVIADRLTPSVLKRHPGTVPSEICLPIKAAAAQARALVASGKVRRVFAPAVLECPLRDDDDEAHVCLYNQCLPDMLRTDLGDAVIGAQFALEDGMLGLLQPTMILARSLGRSVDAVGKALLSARQVQSAFEHARRRLGREALKADFDRAVVVLGKPYNTHDSFLNLGLARLLDEIGLPAIPWDLLPLDGISLDPRWRAVPWHYSREQLRALSAIREDGRLFPILVSSYGCGPDAFVVKHIEEMLRGTPRLLLEFDEHRGEAGLLTRLEAFADEVDVHLAARQEIPATRTTTPAVELYPRGRQMFVPNFAEHARIYAALLRSAGYDAEILPLPDADSVRAGEEQASGRECHPFAIMAGDLCRLVERGGLPADGVFLLPSCATPCLLRQYGDGLRLIAERLGAPVEVWDGASRDLRRITGTAGVLRLYDGLVVTDVLLTLATRLRPYVNDRSALQRLLLDGLNRAADAIAARRRPDAALARTASALWALPRRAEPGALPVVGVTGDLYTRINPAGNAGLFDRLESMGCEVWPSPSFAAMTDLGWARETRDAAQRGDVKGAANQGLTWAVTSARRRNLHSALPSAVRAIAVEPPVDHFFKLASGYVGPGTNHLIMHSVGKIADFLSRGAAGVINAAGINCMVGTAVASSIPRIRADYGHAPVITLVYGGTEGPAQRLRLETFVHRVKERWRRSNAAGESLTVRHSPRTRPRP